MHRVVFLDRGTISENIDIPPCNFPHEWQEFVKTSSEALFNRVKDASIIITNKVEIRREHLEKLPKLKHIAICATGTDAVDLKAASQLGISVSNAPAYATHSVAEHVFAQILSLRRDLEGYRKDIDEGKWQDCGQFCFHRSPIFDLHGSTIGLIGTGAIALQVAHIAKAFNMNTQFYSPSGRLAIEGETLVDFDTLLTSSDIVSVHCPLNDTTEGFINLSSFKKMKTRALFTNTARGSIVNLRDLFEALNKNLIAGAAIDVAPKEPPEMSADIMLLNKLDNCIITPHSAWASQASMNSLMNIVMSNIEAFVNDKRLNIVN